MNRFQNLAFFTGAVLASLAICLVSCRHLLPNIGTHLIGTHNDVVYSFDTLWWHWRMLADLRLTSVLDPPIMAPLPHGHAYGDNMFALALLGAPVAALGGAVLAYNVLVLGTFVLCGVFGAGFGRALTGSRLAGLVVGLTFAFVPFRIEKIHELNNLAAMWVPLAAWALVQWHRSPSWRWLTVGLLAVYAQFLSSIQLFIYLVPLLGVWLLWLWARSRFAVRAPVVWHVAVAVAAAFPLFLPWALVYRQVRAFLPDGRSTDEMRMYTPPIEAWLGKLWPGDVAVALFALAVVIALLALLPRMRRDLAVPTNPHLAPLVAVSMIAFVIAQGPGVVWRGDTWALPFYWLARVYPLLDTVRAPQRVQMVAAAFACGAGGVALAWLTAGVRRLVRRYTRISPSWAEVAGAALPLSLAFLVAVQAPPVSARGRALVLPGVAEALRNLPDGAVVFPVPLFVNHARRPPIDHLALTTGVRMVGGYGGAIPDLFWSLRHHAGEFPEERSIQVVRATGATHVLLHLPSLSPAQQSGTQRLESDGTLHRLFVGATWQLDELAEPSPRRELDPLEQPASAFELRGPSAVAVGQRVTMALVPRLHGVHIDPVVQRPLTIEILADDGGLVDTESAAMFSPQVVERDGFPYQVCLDAPAMPGRYEVRVLWPPCPPWRDRSLVFPLDVRDGLETSKTRPTRSSAIALVGQAHGNRRQGMRLDLALQNEDAHVWLARSDEKLPANQGQLILHTTFRGSAPLHRSHLPWLGFRLLPHDLAPGDQAVTHVYLDAPRSPGDYLLSAAVGPHHVPHGTGAPVPMGEVRVE